MAVKKKNKRPTVRRRHARIAVSIGLLVIILLVSLLIVMDSRDSASAHLTAPVGTSSRSAQIGAAEMNQETQTRASYDDQRHALTGDDSATLDHIAQAVQHAQ